MVRGKNGCRPDGAEIHLGLGFYKDATPTAFRPGMLTTPTELKSFSPALVVAVRQHLRRVRIKMKSILKGLNPGGGGDATPLGLMIVLTMTQGSPAVAGLPWAE